MQIKTTSNSAIFTKELGRHFSKIVFSGDILLFTGELGGGKTTFISGLAKGLGVRDNLSSPSFTILNVYDISRVSKLVHADFYRLKNIEEIIEIGIEDYLYDSSAVVCIEWGDKIKKYIEKDYLEVEISYLPGNKEKDDLPTPAQDRRLILFTSNSLYWNKKLAKFKSCME